MRQVGDTGIHVHPMGIDGSVFGWVLGARQTSAMLDRFADAGGNLVSTADHYAGGRSEVMIGSWLRTLGDRSRAVVATTIGRHPDAAGLGPRAVERATEASLRRLGTDYIDFLTLDGEDPSVPIDDTFETLDMLRRAGKVRHVAVTGHSGARLRAMRSRAQEAAYPPVEAIVQDYSLMTRSAVENELAPVAESLGVGILARHPLGHGFLTGAYRSRDAPLDSPYWERALSHVGRRGTRVLEELGAVAAQQGVSLTRAAAAWVISKPGVCAALVAPRSGDELLDAFGAREVALTRHQMASLDRASE